MSKRHIIVGDGITAAEFATTRRVSAGETITIIGPNVENLGRGIAYAKECAGAPWRYAYLLNSPAISVDLEFSQWIPANWDFLVERMSQRSPDWLGAAKYYVDHGQESMLNAPREIYGDFFHAKVCEKLDVLRSAGICIELLPTRVVGIEPCNNKLKITMQNGQQLSADSVDVATGGPQNQRFIGDDDEHSFPELFGNETKIASKLGSVGNIICIGAGAAMLDLLRFCQSIQTEANINFTAISPSGRVLKPLRPGPVFNPAQYELNGTFACAQDFLSAVILQQQNALHAGHNWYETRVGLRSLFMKTSLNEFIPDINEARKVALPLFNHFQGGTRDSIDDFNRLLESGNTHIVAGSVCQITHDEKQATVVYSNSEGCLFKQRADVVVNCAGPGRTNRFDELSSAMLQQGWISHCPHSGGILVGNDAKTTAKGVRYLGPAVTSIGDSTQPVPMYDAYRLRMAVQKCNNYNQG